MYFPVCDMRLEKSIHRFHQPSLAREHFEFVERSLDLGARKVIAFQRGGGPGGSGRPPDCSAAPPGRTRSEAEGRRRGEGDDLSAEGMRMGMGGRRGWRTS